MKNRTKAAFAIIIMIVLLAACGIRSDKSVTSGEMVAPEVSSEDLLVSSLEYLLLDSDEETTDQETQDASDQETEVQDDPNTPVESEGTSKEQTEDDMQGEEAVIYYGDGGSVALKQEKIEVESVTPEELINALVRHNIVSLDTKVLSFEQEEEDGAALLHLDLSKAVGVYLRTMSKEAECIILAAVANTFLENYNAEAIYITVEGETLVTSYAEYTEPIAQCTPEELLRALEEPDSEKNETDGEGILWQTSVHVNS